MDELEIVRRFYGDAPGPDDVARTRALQRLRALDPSRRRRTRHLWLATGVAGIVAAVAAISLFAGDGTTDELARLGSVAATRDLAAGDLPVVYERTASLDVEVVERFDGDPWFTVEVRRVTELWRSVDGRVSYVQTVDAVSFPTERDRERWAAAKETGVRVPEVGDVTRGAVPLDARSSLDLAELSLDPVELLGQLRGGWWPEPLDDDAEALAAIAELLARGDATPELRRALFGSARELDGIRVLGARADPLGRRGEALSAGQDEALVVVVVDPRTSFVLSIEERLGSLTTWRAYTAWATVDAVGQRPDELA